MPHVPDEPKDKKIVKHDDVREFLPKLNDYTEVCLNMFQYDYVGLIANYHSKLADLKRSNISDDEVCLNLCWLHKVAEDV